MASIVNNSKYGEGHQLILKDKLSVTMAMSFKELGYNPGKSIFKITLKKIPTPTKTFKVSTGNNSVLLLDEKNKKIVLEGSESGINGVFNHFSVNAKSKTNLLTQIKETFSLEIFKNYFELNKTLNEEQSIKLVSSIISDTKNNYDSVYYSSAIKQLEELKKYVNKKNYTYERQGGNRTKELYTVARNLTNKLNDNWNPGDVWMIQKDFDMKSLIKSKNPSELNSKLVLAFKKRDILPISLKQVESSKAKSSIIDPSNMMNQKLDLDLKFDKVDLSNTFNNFIVQTKSGFAVRCGFKASATTLNVSLEGRFIGSGQQTGAVDAKIYTQVIREKFNYNLRSSEVSKNNYDQAKKELKEMFTKYGRLSVKIGNYNEAIKLFDKGNKLIKDRFANLMSYMYSFLIAPKKFEDHLKFCYYTSKKITTDSSLYLIIDD